MLTREQCHLTTSHPKNRRHSYNTVDASSQGGVSTTEQLLPGASDLSVLVPQVAAANSTNLANSTAADSVNLADASNSTAVNSADNSTASLNSANTTTTSTGKVRQMHFFLRNNSLRKTGEKEGQGKEGKEGQKRKEGECWSCWSQRCWCSRSGKCN